MTQAQFNIQSYNYQFFQRYSSLFKNRAPALTNISDYMVSCQYNPEKGPFLVGASNFGVYKTDLLLKYEPHFLYSFPDTKAIAYTFVFNLDNHRHLWVYCYNNPENPSDIEPRFVALPAFYSLDPEDTIKFYEENKDLLIKPKQTPKAFGFAGLANPESSGEVEVNWFEKIAKKD